MLPCLSLHTYNATEPPHPCDCRIVVALGKQPDCSPNGPDDIDDIDIKEGIKKEKLRTDRDKTCCRAQKNAEAAPKPPRGQANWPIATRRPIKKRKAARRKRQRKRQTNKQSQPATRADCGLSPCTPHAANRPGRAECPSRRRLSDQWAIHSGAFPFGLREPGFSPKAQYGLSTAGRWRPCCGTFFRLGAFTGMPRGAIPKCFWLPWGQHVDRPTSGRPATRRVAAIRNSSAAKPQQAWP